MEVKPIFPLPSSALAASNKTTLPADTAVRLWEHFRGGNDEAFTSLYYQHIDALYHYGERLTSDRALIEDCLQDLFAELWNRQTELPEVRTVKFYLFKALKRKIIKKQRRGAVRDFNFEILLASDSEEVPAPPPPDSLRRAINRLSPRQKEVIMLRFYDNFSYEEMADIMSLSSRSVYNLTYRALAGLRRALETRIGQGTLLLFLIQTLVWLNNF